MEGFFVEMDSYAIVSLDYFLGSLIWVGEWKQRDNSMGLILEARGPFSISHSLSLESAGFTRSMTAGVAWSNKPGCNTYSYDDIPVIESST